MSQYVKTYYRVPEIQKTLADIYAANEEAVFIVPSGLDKELMLKLVSGGGSFFGRRPRVRTLGELYDEMAALNGEKSLRVIDPPDHNLIVKYLLDNYLEEMESQGKTLPDGVRHRGFVGVVGDNIKDLLAEEITPKDMEDALFGGEADESEPEYMLYQLYKDYLEYLTANRLADASQIPTLARLCLAGGKAAEFVQSAEFVVIGFLSFAGGQLKLVRELGEKAKKCVFLLPECGLEDFHDAIRQVNEEYKDRPDTTPRLGMLEANNGCLEYAALARELELWVQGRSRFGGQLGELADFGEVGIIVPQKSLELLAGTLSRYKIPFNVQIRGTVAQTRAGGLPGLVWGAYRRGWPTRGTMYLLLDPLLGCVDFDRARCLEKFPEGEEGWLEVLSGRSLSVFEMITSFCESMADELAPAEILDRWRSLLNDLNVVRNAAAYIGDDFAHDAVLKDLSSCMTELDKKIGRLRDLNSDLGPAARVTMSGDDAVRYLQDWGREATLPIPLPQSHSVTVYAGPPPTLASHKFIILTDVDYNSWPGRLRESPLLRNENKQRLNADSEQRFKARLAAAQFHLPEMRDEREQKEGLFRRLIATGAQGAILTRSMTDEEGRPVGESQFAAALAEEIKSRQGPSLEESTVRYPLAASLPGDGEVCFKTAEVSMLEKQRSRGIMPRVGGSAPDAEVKFSVSLSSLDDWIACPYRWWCGRGLKLARTSAELYDPALAGSFLHRLWELAWGEYKTEPKSFVILAKKHWDAALAQEYPALAVDARLKRHAARLEKQALKAAALQDEMEALLPGRSGLELEYELPVCEVDGVAFRGRADRIDLYDDGFVVVDYKSNRAAQHLNDYQLAAYSVILQKALGLEPLGYGWLGHGDASFRGYFRDEQLRKAYLAPASRRKDGKNLGSFLTEVAEQMKKMSESVKGGVFPALYDSDKCRVCEFFTVCRRREAPYYRPEEDEDDER